MEKRILGKLKKISSDAIATNLFNVALTFPIDVALIGIGLNEYANTRLLNIIPSSVSGAILGSYRDFMTEKFKYISDRQIFGKYILDGIISGTFSVAYLPIYFLTMNLAEVEFDEMIRSSEFMVARNALFGPLLGKMIDKVRMSVDTLLEVKIYKNN